MKKIVLCFWLFLALGFTNKAVGQFAGGSGTETDPYQISTPDHLVQLFYYLGNANVHFKMINNIDLTSYLAPGGAGHNSGAGWSPIGNEGNKFSGSLEGAGFKITGLWIDRSSTDYIGLFGHVDAATISNLRVEIATAGISGRSYVGGLIGFSSNSIVIDCCIIGDIRGGSNEYSSRNFVGGLIGGNEGVITNCYIKGNVSVSTYSNNNFVGGLIGSNGGPITNCYVIGNVSSNNEDNYYSDNSVGGLIGYNGNIVTNCYFTGDVSGIGNSISVGGLIGTNGGTVSDCYVTWNSNINGNNTGGISRVGGLIGWNNKSKTVSGCYAAANVSGIGSSSSTTNPQNGNLVGGLIGSNNFSTVTKCNATGDVSGSGNSYSNYVGGLIGYYCGWTVAMCYATGDVKGTGNGNSNSVGGLVGYCFGGNFSNCYATGEVNCNVISTNYVGGLLGYLEPYMDIDLVSNCYAAGKVSGNDNVGGFIGYHKGTIDNSFFDYQTSGQIYAIGSGIGTVNNLTGKSTAEMKTKTTFTSVNWDFTTVWGINEGVSYPFLINGSVGMNEPVQNVNIQLYPNPTNGLIHIENKGWNVNSVEIFDVIGKNIIINTQIRPENSENKIVINISHLPAGVYFVRISTETGDVIKKVLKE